MNMRFTRQEILKRLGERIEAGSAILVSGAGTGLTAKFAEEGGADLIVVYNSGRFRMAGHASAAGLLAYGDANQIVKEMGAREILPVVEYTPVIAGVNGTDPMRQMEVLLCELVELGYSGVINFPTVGVIDGRFRMRLEHTNLGYDREIALIRQAHAMDIFTCAYVFNPEEAYQMAAAGADVIVAHLETTVGGSTGVAPDMVASLAEAPLLVQAIGESARAANPESLLFCHGGPIATPEDARYVIERTASVGFVGASSIERLPIEQAIVNTVKQFKQIRLPVRPSPDGGSANV